ncbi:MAG: hypothetical protein HYZ53_26850 [Planctomycetes bacterium]|nr:hypothetical protein [Planctomycetota bacterium]
MGLDVYVGSLTRYYAGDWKTIVQQAGERAGFKVVVARPNQPQDAVVDRAQVHAHVLAWREGLTEALGEHVQQPLDWDESAESPYFTNKPAWDCYSDLLLWAAHDEHPHFGRPEHCVEDWTKDPAWKASNAAEFQSRFSHLLRPVQLWLPVDFTFTFSAVDPTGSQVGMGSSVTLLRQMLELNERTWKAGGAQLDTWRRAGAEQGATLETGARFAFSLLLALTRDAVEHRLPMKLDY